MKCGTHHFCNHAGVDEPDSRQPHIQVSEKQTLKVKVQSVLNADDRQKIQHDFDLLQVMSMMILAMLA